MYSGATVFSQLMQQPNANEKRDWRIYAEFAQILIQQANTLYIDDSVFPDPHATVYALDSTTIDLCMMLFPWAHFRRAKSTVKMHALLNLCGNIPEFILITEGNVHDVNVLDHLVPLPGSYYVMDRGYLDFERLYTLHTLKAYFVTRAKKNFQFQRRYSHPIDRSTGLICDQTVFQMDQAALRIKSFYGTSANAVKTQIWIAICVYLLVAIMKKRMNIEQSLYTILHLLSVSVFEKRHLLQAFQSVDYSNEGGHFCNQLSLWD